MMTLEIRWTSIRAVQFQVVELNHQQKIDELLNCRKRINDNPVDSDSLWTSQFNERERKKNYNFLDIIQLKMSFWIESKTHFSPKAKPNKQRFSFTTMQTTTLSLSRFENLELKMYWLWQIRALILRTRKSTQNSFKYYWKRESEQKLRVETCDTTFNTKNVVNVWRRTFCNGISETPEFTKRQTYFDFNQNLIQYFSTK